MGCHNSQELIDKQIAVHESAIRDLRTLRNTHASISKLPVEVLSEIFLLAKLPPGILYRERHEKRGWLNVAGVCRNWREITLNAPRKWDTLNTSKLNTLEWAETFIARSKYVPLHVSCTYPHHATPRAVLDLVFSHVERFQDLEISLDTSHNAKIQDIIDLPSPCVLRSLALYNQGPLFSANTGGIGRFLSEAQMPYLRTLDVRHFELPQTISVLPQLRRLCYLPPMGTSRTTVAAMLSFLRSTPSLEHLDILSALRPLDNGGKETATVELTKLSSLSYTTPEFGDLSLFRFLHYPPSLRVKFSSSFPPPDIVACTDDLASILARVGESDAAATAEVISLTAMEHDYFDVQVSSHDRPMVDIRFPVLDILPLLKLPTKLPCSGARTLRIRGFRSVTVSDWASFFTRHPQVQDLTAVEVDTSFFWALLRPSENEPPPFMGIQRLVLSSCDIEEDTTLFKRVLDEHRQLEANVGVTLEIKGCRVAADTIRELEAYAKVVWDGIKKLRVDSEEDSKDSDDDEDSDDSDEDSDYD